MALISCPECHKENISDTAEYCPYCGYNIKQHKQQEYLRQYQTIMHDIQFKNVQLPQKPTLFNSNKGIIWLSFFFLFVGFFSIISGSKNYGVAIFLILLGVLIFCLCYFGNYKKALKMYELSQQNPDAYREMIVAAEIMEYEKLRSEIRAVPTLYCPVCGSTAVSNISTLNRATSVALVGLASDKIGKQYKCHNCGHMW